MCNTTFKILKILKAHQCVRTGECPYHCELCNKTFSNKGNLKVHQHLHSGDRPYRCDICRNIFSQISNLMKRKIFMLFALMCRVHTTVMWVMIHSG